MPRIASTDGNGPPRPALSVWHHLANMVQQQSVDLIVGYLTPHEAEAPRLRFGMPERP